MKRLVKVSNEITYVGPKVTGRFKPKDFMHKAIQNTILTVLTILLFVGTASADTLVVPVGGNVQAALNSANCGDAIVLQAGAVYVANLTLPVKSCNSHITIQSSRANELPEGVRVGPAQVNLFAKLQSNVNGLPVIQTAAGARYYKFTGLEISTTTASVVVYDLVRFGEGRDTQKTFESVPHNLIIDRCWIHGHSTQDVQRGVSLNSAETVISNSYISDIHGVGFDTQAIAGWNGPGPFKIINNYLEGAGENILFGGADSASESLMPANIEIRRNYVFKPLSWKVGDPAYAGKHWTVKNLLELKAARNVVIDGNIFENNWVDGQTGIPILFTVRNQDCTAPWSTIQNVTFSNNIVTNSMGVFNFLGVDNETLTAASMTCARRAEPKPGSVRGSDVTISNGLFYNINGAFVTMNGFNNVTMDRLTHLQKGNLTTIYGEPSSTFKYTNSLTIDHQYGLWTEAGVGVVGLNKLTPGWVVEGNVIAAPYDKNAYPPNNSYPTTLSFPADFRSPISGKGADIDQILAAQNGSVAGPVTNPSPSPSPTATPTPSPTPTATPTPTPTPSPSPSPAVVPESNVVSWPSSKGARKSLWDQMVKDRWKCVPYDGVLYCWR